MSPRVKTRSAGNWLRRFYIKHVIIITLCLCSTGLLGQALPEPATECSDPLTKKAILQIAQDWKSGYNEGNPDKVAALYAQDATYLTQHFITGIVHGRPAIRAYVKKGTDAKYKIESLTVLASDCSGHFAYALTRYVAINRDQTAFGVNLVVMKKVNSRWLIVAHESAVPDPATAIKTLDLAVAE